VANTFFVTDNRDQIARPAAAQGSNQLRQEAGCEGLSSDIQIDVSRHRNACILQSGEHLRSSRAPYCAVIHLSDPVTLTATSVKNIRIGLPSA
jgi:hypothetical protein